MREDFRFWHPVTVRWGDMDAHGHVNNAKYFTFSESARIAYMRNLAISDIDPSKTVGPGLVSITCNFRRQVRHPAELDVGVRCGRVKGKTFTLELEYYEREGVEPVADGHAVMVWVDYSIPKSVPVPQEFVAAAEAFEGRMLRESRE